MVIKKMELNTRANEWLRLLVMMSVVIVLMFMANQVWATDGTEFQDAAEKFEGWIQGYLGKLAALIALAIGAIATAIRKDWTWFIGAVILSMGMGILLGIVNSSFTATV